VTTIGTSFPSIDEALGGLITGDNVVWICDVDDEVYGVLCAGLTRGAVADRQRVIYVSFDATPHFELAGVERIDASPTGPFGRPSTLADELDRRTQTNPPACVIFEDLARPARRWGIDAAVEFFSRVCPSMLQAGVTAYWSVDHSLGLPALESIRQITQCLFDVRGGRLRVVKAEGRVESQQSVSYLLTTDGDELVAEMSPAGGRLARGLLALRRELGMTQSELAAIAGITASAISQAESGTRGLSVDTLLRISDRLVVPIDRLVNAAPTPSYHLSRHDRSRLIGDGVTALVADASIGARVYLIDLDAGGMQKPAVEHQGIEVIAVVRGLVQIDLGEDRPVLRSGDTLVVDTASVRSWRNLRREPARFFRILRD
jgi:transcriptional regulator with XRE-family HTH domain